MEKKIGDCVLELVQGDITEQETEAVVNAANKRLAPGGGVAGAIHRKAGRSLWEECRTLGGCETGEAKITSGHGLKADHIINTVGPVYSGSERDERLLRSSYRNSLDLAVKNGLDSVCFPALSTGAFGYPVRDAAKIALDEIKKFLEDNGEPKLVRMTLYSQGDFDVHVEELEKL